MTMKRLTLKSSTVIAVSVASVSIGLAACSSSGTSAPTDSASAAPSTTQSASGASISKELPASWPSDIPAPEGLTLISVTSTELAGQPRSTAIYEGGTPQIAVVDQLSAGLKSAGYTQSNRIDGPAVIMNWMKNGLRVGVNVTTNEGKTVASITVVPK